MRSQQRKTAIARQYKYYSQHYGSSLEKVKSDRPWHKEAIATQTYQNIMTKVIDLTGRTFGRLKVLGRSDIRKGGRIYWQVDG